MLEIHNK